MHATVLMVPHTTMARKAIRRKALGCNIQSAPAETVQSARQWWLLSAAQIAHSDLIEARHK